MDSQPSKISGSNQRCCGPSYGLQTGNNINNNDNNNNNNTKYIIIKHA